MSITRRSIALIACTLFLLCGAALSFVAPAPAYAQVDAGLNAVGQTVQLPSTDPRVIAARIINVVLGLLAIIMVVLILYAGFLWMTAGGNAEQVDKAKLYIRNAIIGVIIILSSWAIATFVINRLLASTGGGGGGVSGSGPVGGSGALGTGSTPSAFQISSINPSGSVAIRNVQVRFLFNRSVNPASASSSFMVLRASDATVVPGFVQVDGSLVTFTPSATCPDPNADRHCFEASTEFIARATGSVQATNGLTLTCGGFAPACEVRFQTGTIVDTASPTAAITSPFNGQSLPEGNPITIVTHATDDGGVSIVETDGDGVLVGRDGPSASSTPQTFDASISWDTVGVANGTHTLQSRVFDVDSNSTQSASVSVAIRPQHCFNGLQDADEAAIDCGGPTCGACAGGVCTSGTDCSSGVCKSGLCVEQPIVTGYSPADGRPGTFVTIVGMNFGDAPGTVRIGGQPALAPAVCTGLDTWTGRQIVVALPDGAITGPIEVQNTAQLSDSTTDDAFGPHLPDFTVNDIAHPGLCAAAPLHDEKGRPVTLRGAGLGSSSGAVLYDDREYTAFRTWADTQIDMYAPNISPGTYAVKARTASSESNTVAFTIDEPVRTNPVIDSIDPGSGPVGEYITLTGRDFGDQIGTVKFRKSGTDQEGLAAVDFPAACATNFWHNGSVTVKVPARIRGVGLGGDEAVAPGGFEVSLVRQDGSASNRMPFTVNTATPHPGICSIEPAAGPIATQVTIIGERLGTSAGDLIFRSGVSGGRIAASVDPTRWTASQIVTNVPAGAITGSVRVEVASQVSNSVNYTVRNCNEDPTICSVGATCCRTGECSVGGRCTAAATEAQFAWRLSTGVIPLNPEVVEDCRGVGAPVPSPSPWSGRNGGGAACVNADVIARFNTRLDPATVLSSSFLVRKCTAAGAEPCATTAPVPALAGYPEILPSDALTDFIRFRPNTLGQRFATSSTYEVILTTAIRSVAGIAMLENAGRCGAGNAYCFRFTTRPSTENCRVGSVTVQPEPFTARDIGEEVRYSANPLSADDKCIALNGSSMNWNWYTGSTAGTPDGRASLTNNTDPAPPSRTLDTQTATALAETGSSPILVNAEAINPGQPNVRGTGHLSVNMIPPKVDAFGPNCDQACVNAAIWARFNVGMDPARVLASNVILKRCVNETCVTFDEVFDLSEAPMRLTAAPGATAPAPLNYLVIEPTHFVGGVRTSFLDPERFYRVVLRGGTSGFRSRSFLPLVGMNDPDGFGWSFRVKNADNARCSAASVQVLPEERIETLVGARQSFAGQPIGSPDACSADGQPLITDQTFAWTSTDANVARFVNASGFGTVDTSPNLPAHCSIRCVNVGADGALGSVASCGNSIVESTDGRFCQRPDHTACRPGDTTCQTVFGDVCRMLGPGAHGSEECDLGTASNGRAGSTCSASCLWTGDTGGRCGNGVVDAGEQCDSRIRVCGAGQMLGRICAVDADCGTGSTCGLQARRGCSDTCQALGSSAAGATCGNNDIADGETCDDGNTGSGDGCNADCLHEGSTAVTAICGNTILEPGESCEKVGATWPVAGCDRQTCLRTGTDACSTPPIRAPGSPVPTPPFGCCGNGMAEAGEEPSCESAIWTGHAAEGCSERCLKLGSSIAYATPSICGDGVVGAGEQCEAAPGGDGLVDAEQAAEVVGTRDLLPAEEASRRMTTAIRAEYDTKIGEATYGLQCGFANEIDCNRSGRTGYGLTASGCCSLRPRLIGQYPPGSPPGNSNVCRNALIYATFDVPMDQASVASNFFVAEKVTAANCPAGSRNVDSVPFAVSGWRGRIAGFWHRIVSFFRPAPAQADLWCVGGIPGRITVEAQGEGTRVSFILEQALKANTEYWVVLRGDPNLTDAARQGMKSRTGVLLNGNISWSFQTGSSICTASEVTIEDTNIEHPYLFTHHVEGSPETHLYRASILYLQDGSPVPLTPVREYSWNWDPWTSSMTNVLALAPSDDTDPAKSKVIEQNKNGSSLIFARILVNRDEINLPSTSGTRIEASRESTVILCERPWPSLTLAPFSDASRSPSLVALAPAFASGPYFNFATTYCMDAGNASTTADDLPSLSVSAVPPSTSDASRGILRQYLFTFAGEGINPELHKDGIGIRVIANPLHLSPAAWYASQGFSGTPSSAQVDGYEAVKDGTTTYVAGTNISDTGVGSVYTTIYLISHNPDANPQTIEIYNKLLENWSFNVNLQTGSDNTCVRPDGSHYLDSAGAVLGCTADWECAKLNTDLVCASAKAKLQRDTRRIADFQTLTDTVELSKTRAGSYPTLASGSFLQTISTSKWPSWQESLGSAVQKTNLPQDPVNRFVSCGRCKSGSTLGQVCTDSSECPTGSACVAEVGADAALNGFNPATCWNETARRYMCPRVSGSTSHVYQYRSVDNGSRYEIAAELEGPGYHRYEPPLLTEIFKCSNTGQNCRGADHPEDCNVVGPDGRTVLGSGTCNATGGRWIYQGMCAGREFGTDDVCGNGVRGSGELCEIGETATASCTAGDGRAGTKVQSCSDCNRFVDTVTTSCVANSQCGNGVVDRYRCYAAVGTVAGYKYGQSCSGAGRDTECADARDLAGTAMRCESVSLHGGAQETCDDGALNGTYGHCRRDCGGTGAYCGDRLLSLGESCDNGMSSVDPTRPANGQYCDTLSGCSPTRSCSLDCRAASGYCGDHAVQSPEQCDGNVEETTNAICTAGTNIGQPCVATTDCGTGGVCGGAGADSCANVTASVCVGGPHAGDTCTGDATCAATEPRNNGRCIAYPTRRTRVCVTPGAADQCRWNAWSACQATSRCGDGVTDSAEECDDGNTSDYDACTSLCRRNVCGDGFPNSGVEECDLGTIGTDPSHPANGQACTGAEYGLTCTSCSATCHMVASSGGFCGDGVRNGAEQCDRTDVPPTSCQALGYDYSVNGVTCAHYAFTEETNIVGQKSVGRSGTDYCYQGPGGVGICLCPAVLPPGVTGCRIVGDSGTNVVSLPSSLAVACKPATRTDALTCTATCGYSGCGRCSDVPAPSDRTSITARVYDAVDSTQSVPNARVTLYYQGVRIGESFSDTNGAFTFTNLNRRTECGGYRIVIDSYVNNPNTATTDEGVNGGYWPYESMVFNAEHFMDVGIQNNQGKVFLIPRVAPDETLVVHTWNGDFSSDYGNRFLLSHLILPVNRSFTLTDDPDHGRDWTVAPTCGAVVAGNPQGPFSPVRNCFRDIREHAGGISLQGNPDLTQAPYARLYCTSGDATTQACFQIRTAPQATKYKRAVAGVDPQGTFSYYLVDQRSTTGVSPASWRYFGSTQSRVYVVTGNRIYTITPPSTGPSNCNGKYWLVFQQNAATGNVTVNTTGATAYHCGQDQIRVGTTVDHRLPGCAYRRWQADETDGGSYDFWDSGSWLQYGSWGWPPDYSGIDWDIPSSVTCP